MKHCHGNGFNIANSLYYVRISWRARTAANFVYRLHALFIYLIPEDVLSGNSTIFGVTGALLNLSYLELYSPIKTTTTTTTTTMDKLRSGNENYELFCSLKVNGLAT